MESFASSDLSTNMSVMLCEEYKVSWKLQFINYKKFVEVDDLTSKVFLTPLTELFHTSFTSSIKSAWVSFTKIYHLIRVVYFQHPYQINSKYIPEWCRKLQRGETQISCSFLFFIVNSYHFRLKEMRVALTVQRLTNDWLNPFSSHNNTIPQTPKTRIEVNFLNYI